MTLTGVPAVRAAWRSVTAFLFVVLVVAFAAPTANAHAVLVDTEPGFDSVVTTAPSRVLLRFNEPVETALGSVRVFDSAGERVDTGSVNHVEGESSIAVDIEPDLARGTYTTTWSVISGDSHPIRGAFVWHVGAPGPRPDGIADQVLGTGVQEGVLFGVARWLTFGGLLLLVGAWYFACFTWRGRGEAWTVPSTTADAFRGRYNKTLMWSWVVLVVATLAGIVLQGASATGAGLSAAMDPELISDVLETRYGRAGLVRLGVLVAGAIVWLGWSRTAAAERKSGTTRASVGAAAAEDTVPALLLVAGAACSMVLLATPGLAGHAASSSPVSVNVAADTLHLAASAVWIGGLATLVLAAFPSTAGLEAPERARVLAPVVARFSDAAVVAVGVIVVTGTYRAWVEIGTLDGLTGTSYGLALMMKLGAFLPLLVLGAINNRMLKPRLAAAANSSLPDALPAIKRTVVVEVILAGVVLAVTAVLVNLAPARSEVVSEGDYVADVRLGNNNLNVLVDPARVGVNIVHLTATHASGAPAEIKRMTVRLEQPARGIGPISARARKLATGHFVVQGRHLSVSGRWRLQVVAEIDKFTQQRASLEFEVGS